jgi:hypothetical protein
LDILDSLEVRWFFADAHPAAVAARDWFKTTVPEDRRVDHYLLTGRDDLGFKARMAEKQPTKAETKYLLGSLGAMQLAAGVAGRIERWRKLSLSLDDPELRRHGSWISVEKSRQLRKFAFDNGQVTEVPGSSRPDAGCGVELTQLHYHRDGNPLVEWTFGLEAFGPELGLLDVLQATSRVTFAAGAGFELGADCSDSYPGWLRSRLARSQ